MTKHTKTVKKSFMTLTIVLLIVSILGTLVGFAPNKMVSADVVPNATIINCNSCVNMRVSPTTKSNLVTKVSLGTRVLVTATEASVAGDSSGYSTWYQIQVAKSGTIYYGYICSYYVSMDSGNVPVQDAAFETMIASFPDSYKPYLRQLHIDHPTWVFVPETTKIDWSSALDAETASGKSLVQNTVDSSWISHSYSGIVDSPNWVNASRAIVAYYMDPRNGLNNNGIFQFLDLSYETDGAITEGSVESALSGTFMANTLAQYGTGDSSIYYRQIFSIAANQSNVNPIFLCARVIQECGTSGSTSSNGSSGVYNFFNIGAYSNVISASRVGLDFARNGLDAAFNSTYNIPWVTPGLSIVNGARWINDYYASKGQNTVYYMRFNVAGDSSYSACAHQYMTATQSAFSESSKMYSVYNKAGLLSSALTFVIPVYANMPDTVSPLPTSTNCYDSFVQLVFEKTLGRTPSAQELSDRSSQLSNGRTAISMIVEFITSAEFNNRGLTDTQFIQLMYQLLLGRDAEAAGLASHLSTLEQGYSRMTVFANICNSAECHAYLSLYSVPLGSYTSDDFTDMHMSYRPFIASLYSGFLGRSPDASGIRNWVNQIASGALSGPQVAAAFCHSTEFQSLNLSNDEFVRRLYQVCLGRECDTAGYNHWMSMLDNHYSRDYILAGFVNSPEFQSICNSYSISIAEYVASSTREPAAVDTVQINAFVTRLYSLALSREPDPAGFSDWTSQLTSRTGTGYSVAYGFIFSPELIGRNLSNEDFVRLMYSIFLDREPDEAGFNDWVGRLNSGASREDIFNGFVYSPEFANVCYDAGFYPC